MKHSAYLILVICLVVTSAGCERIQHHLGDPQEAGTYVMYEEPRVIYNYEVDPNDPPTSHLKK